VCVCVGGAEVVRVRVSRREGDGCANSLLNNVNQTTTNPPTAKLTIANNKSTHITTDGIGSLQQLWQWHWPHPFSSWYCLLFVAVCKNRRRGLICDEYDLKCLELRTVGIMKVLVYTSPPDLDHLQHANMERGGLGDLGMCGNIR